MSEYNIRGLCVNCGAVYRETPYSFLCPKCRKAYQSESAKKRNLSKIGNAARSSKSE